MRLVDGVDAARAGNIKVDSTMKSKQLQLNPDKNNFILLGPNKLVENARREVLMSPLMCGNFVTRAKVADKWLCDLFH